MKYIGAIKVKDLFATSWICRRLSHSHI